MALASWYARDPVSVEQLFQHVTPTALTQLDEGILAYLYEEGEKNDPSIPPESHRVLAKAAIRRIAHKQLDKYSSIVPSEQLQAALKYHTLPPTLQTELWSKYGGSSPPNTWWDALERLREISGDDSSRLWRMVLEHPMTDYVPMQCQNCGHEVPDVASGLGVEDIDLGLSEVEPEIDDGVLELRGGWFRGRPRAAKILQLDCPKCHFRTRWYRSSHPQVMLKPYRWGRLCGEQEDLRLALANYLGIKVRTCVPLDWDHIWSEFGTGSERSGTSTLSKEEWHVLDDNARNFAVRLDEGIGGWTGVFGIHPDPSYCQDLTEGYLQCSNTGGRSGIGRADPRHSNEMTRYRTLVEEAQSDRHGGKTQAKTVVGYLLQRAGMTSDDITAELQCAARDYGERSWWQV